MYVAINRVFTPSSLLANSLANRDMLSLNWLLVDPLESNILFECRILCVHYSPLEVNNGRGEFYLLKEYSTTLAFHFLIPTLLVFDLTLLWLLHNYWCLQVHSLLTRKGGHTYFKNSSCSLAPCFSQSSENFCGVEKVWLPLIWCNLQ